MHYLSNLKVTDSPTMHVIFSKLQIGPSAFITIIMHLLWRGGGVNVIEIILLNTEKQGKHKTFITS